MTKQKIGFIGLGLMGRAMVECLQQAGHALVVLGHSDRTGIDAALSRGGTEAPN
ncbi:NAD(P)-binding domain-containing protein, partial [Profundicola chukchiensis]